MQSPTLFFVCGHPRSGTNWVRALLNVHPRIICLGESPFARIWEVIQQAATQEWSAVSLPEYRAAIEAAFANMVRECTLTYRQSKPLAVCVGDHTPRLLWPYVPGTRHIHMVRDGRDVLVSWTWHNLRYTVASHPFLERARRLFRDDPGYYSANPRELLADEEWVRSQSRSWGWYIKWDRETMDRMKRGELIGSVMTFRFEDVHADTRECQFRMIRYLAMDPSDLPPLSESTKTSAGFTNEDPTSFYRSGKVGDWRRYFSGESAHWFNEEAGEGLVLAGYEPNGEWVDRAAETGVPA